MTHYISSSQDILGGEPVITGTRIPVERMAFLVESGYTEQDLKREFSGISIKKIRGALYELATLGLEQLKKT